MIVWNPKPSTIRNTTSTSITNTTSRSRITTTTYSSNTENTLQSIQPKLRYSVFIKTSVLLLGLLLVTTTQGFDFQFPFVPKNNSQFTPSSSSFFSSTICTDPEAYLLKSQRSTPTATMRAWTCHGRTQKEMVENLVKAGIVKSKPVQQALLQVDRSNYVSEPSQSYIDAPQSLGYGQTISAPHMHAHALEELLPALIQFSDKFRKQDEQQQTNSPLQHELKILDVGCGSGYLTATLGRLVSQSGPIAPLYKGRVFGIDVYPQLVQQSQTNIQKQDSDLIQTKTVSLSVGNGWAGLESDAPYHAIHVGAAAESFPKNLMMQLHPEGGMMVIPVGPDGGVQNLYKVTRINDNNVFDEKDFVVKSLLGVRYVPLVHSKDG